MGRRWPLAALAVLTLLISDVSLGAKGEEEPPENTTLKFKKTLYVHKWEKGKIFTETRKLESGDTIWRILKDEYGVSEELMVTLVDLFREVNPGLNPNKLTAGQIVRVPFKLESELGTPPPPAPPKAPSPDYSVRPGDTLWKILKNVYGVKKEEMAAATAKVVSANKGVKDINRLWVGQVLVIPDEVARNVPKPPEPEPRPVPKEEAKPGVPEYFSSMFDLLAELGCSVDREGDTYVPVERGRTVKLNAREFPIIIGPSGKKLIADMGSRLDEGVKKTLETSWGYTVVRTAMPSVEEGLKALLPHLGFYEIKEGPRSININEGVSLFAQTIWSVAAKPGDVWEGRMHLIFPKGAAVDPVLAKLAAEKGFATHTLETDREASKEPTQAAVNIPVLDFADPVKGLADFLGLSGIHAITDADVELKLDGGVTYRMRIPLHFRHGNMNYAISPATPARAESLLLRAGFFTLPKEGTGGALGKIKDVAALLAIPHTAGEIEVPAAEALKLRIHGVKIDDSFLADALYPPRPGDRGKRPPVFITGPALDPRFAALLVRSGYLPVIAK